MIAEGKVYKLPDPAATTALAACCTPHLRKGDLIVLQGELGTGKTTFARALIRCLLGDQTIQIPSPTFSLVQHYETADGLKIAHYDWYRLRHEDEIAELGFDEDRAMAVTLVEWPEHAMEAVSSATLWLHFHQENGQHSVLCRCDPHWQAYFKGIGH
jgi:tRNA threonylcarbamoyl adenosine modification protein YjeE